MEIMEHPFPTRQGAKSRTKRPPQADPEGRFARIGATAGGRHPDGREPRF
jgi:hypothetical protein